MADPDQLTSETPEGGDGDMSSPEPDQSLYPNSPMLDAGPPVFWILAWPPPAPSAPVAAGPTATIADVEGAAETHKDTPARALTVDQAKAVLLDLKAKGAMTVSDANILGLSIMDWGVVVGSFKVRKPSVVGQPLPPLKPFEFSTKGTPVDPRLAVLMYRLATYLYVEHDATGMTTMGFARSHERPELSCHNQGRAVDFKGVLWGTESITVEEHWGALPFRQDGKIVRKKRGSVTKKFDEGDEVIGIKAIEGFVGGRFTEEIRQERLNPELVVDAAILRSVLGMADPGLPETWSEDTRKTAEALQIKLRKAAKVFLGIFDFFVRESTLEGGNNAFTAEQMTQLYDDPISRTNSGNICIPDGSVWDGHQNHFHAQIGVTGWAAAQRSESSQAPALVDAGARKFLYDRTASMIVKLLKEAWSVHKTAADKALADFEKQKVKGQRPADAVWEDQPEAKTHARRLAIAGGYTDESVKRRIERFDDPTLVEIGPNDPIRFHTRRGRVLTRWYHKVKGGQAGPGPTHWRSSAWLGTLVADTSLSEEQARTRLVTAIDQDLSTWRDAVIAEEGT